MDMYTNAARQSSELRQIITADVEHDDPVLYWTLLNDHPDMLRAELVDVYVESVDHERWLDAGHRKRLVTGLLTAIVNLDGLVHGDRTETAANVAVAYTFTGEYTAGQFVSISVERVV